MSCNTDEFRHLVDGNMSYHPRHQSFTDSRTVSWATEVEHTAAAEWKTLRFRWPQIVIAMNVQCIRFSGGESDMIVQILHCDCYNSLLKLHNSLLKLNNFGPA